MTPPADRAARLRALHVPGEPLLLPNAWDVASAERIAALGFPAVATTSSGVAGSLGFADGQETPVAQMLAVVERVAAAVDVPVTADMEAGYGLPPAELAARLLDAGAAGLNLEDTERGDGEGPLVDADRQAERIAVLAQAGLVVNARIDVHVRAAGPPPERLEEALRRARLYFDAGAACVFPIFLDEEEELRAFVGAVDGPVNALLRGHSPTYAQMRAIGIARISTGSGLADAALDHAALIAGALRDGDDGPLRRATGGAP